MILPPNITITKRIGKMPASSFAVLILVAALAFGHGGFDHVMGTIVKFAPNVLTVKTSKGNVDVKVDDKTELTKSGAKAQFADLTAGARVVIDIPEGSKDEVAHSVKIGTVGKVAPSTH